MPNIDIINGEIADLEAKTMTYAIAERLAWLYIVRDHCCIGQQVTPPAIAGEPVDTQIEYKSDTEFSQAVDGKKLADVWPVLDEMMSTLEIMLPKLYDVVMRKLRE